MKKIFIFLLSLFIFSCGGNEDPADPFSLFLENKPYVLNGTPGDHSQFPSIVFITRNKTSETCSGSLIKDDLVLTAAHCTYLLSSSQDIVYGFNSVPDSDCESCFKKISGHKYHEEYDTQTMENDISIILLEKPILNATPGTLIPELYLPLIEEDQTLTIAGYGTNNDGELGKLFYGDLPITSVLSDKEMILGEDDPDAVNACYGDSGGPAYLVVDDEQYITGVTSRVPPNVPVECGHGAVYVRPSAYIDWIEDTYQQLLVEREESPPKEDPEEPNDNEGGGESSEPDVTTIGRPGCSMGYSTQNTLWPIFLLMLVWRRYGQRNRHYLCKN